MMFKLLVFMLLAIAVQCCPQEAITLLDEVNAHRREYSLYELSLDRELTAIAIARLPEVMANYSHDGAEKYTHPYLIRSELLCRTLLEGDYAIEACIGGWMSSTLHRSEMLNLWRSKAGIAGAKADDGRTYFVLWLES